MYEQIEIEMQKRMNEILLNRLLRHFKLDNEDYSELHRQQCCYVYDRISEVCGPDVTVFFKQLDDLEKHLHSRKMDAVYYHLKMANMLKGDYDFSTTNPPLNLNGYDKGWRL